VLDFSDFYWYRSFAELTRQGYYPYYNLWTTYPPLFPAVMLPLYQLSTLLPPWTAANLWFSLLLGTFFLIFELGNFILLYLFALKLYPPRQALRPCWIYASLFIPVYTMTGWFENYPLFFFLLSLYLLLENRPYLSAISTGVGFMIKLIPIILIPIAIRNILSHYKVQNLIMASLPRLIIYFSLLSLTVILIGLPFYLLNPALFFGSQQITAARQPWETVWALMEGNYDYGVIPLDMRDLAWTMNQSAPSHLPWLWITLAFGLMYGLVYLRPMNWQQPQTIIAFAAFTNAIFMLWSKGYSPQWLGWVLYFIALLLPNMRGLIYCLLLSIANILEANFFFIMFPDDHWLLQVTVITRTVIFAILALEFLLLIWPHWVTPRVAHLRRITAMLLLATWLIGSLPATWFLTQSYYTARLAQSPYHATITRLQHEKVTGALLLNDHSVYDWFYPYLRHNYQFFMLDDYQPTNDTVESRMTALLNNVAAQTPVLLVYDANAAQTTPAEIVLQQWLKQRPPAHIQDIDGGRLYLFILQ